MFPFDKWSFSGGLIVAAAEGFKLPYVSRMGERLPALKQTGERRTL